MSKPSFGNIFDKTSPAKKTAAISDETPPKQVLFRLNEAAKKQLDIMALENDTSRQALMIEAVNRLFKKFGKPQIA